MRRHASLDPEAPDHRGFVIRLRKHYSTSKKAFAFLIPSAGNSSVLPNPSIPAAPEGRGIVVPTGRLCCCLGQTMPNASANANGGACADAIAIRSESRSRSKGASATHASAVQTAIKPNNKPANTRLPKWMKIPIQAATGSPCLSF